MEATLSELHQQTREIMQPVIQRGEEVILTEFGKPVAKIVPYIPTKIFDDPDAMRQGKITDQAITDALRDSREARMQQFDPL